jgi:hypothetical protein
MKQSVICYPSLSFLVRKFEYKNPINAISNKVYLIGITMDAYQKNQMINNLTEFLKECNKD